MIGIISTYMYILLEGTGLLSWVAVMARRNNARHAWHTKDINNNFHVGYDVVQPLKMGTNGLGRNIIGAKRLQPFKPKRDLSVCGYIYSPVR